MSEAEKIYLIAQDKSDAAKEILFAFLHDNKDVMQEYFSLLDKHIDAENEKNRALNKIQK